MGSATCWAICSDEAPGFVAVTATDGNSTGGINSRRSILREMSPKTIMTMVTNAIKARFFMLSFTSQSSSVLIGSLSAWNNIPSLQPENSIRIQRKRCMDLKRRLRPRANCVGAYLMIVVSITIFIPTPYTIQSPGPTFDTLEQVEVEGSSYHMVEIDGAKTYPTDGSLNLTTISVSGPPTSASLTPQVLYHAILPYPSITPAELLYPPETTGDEVRDQNAEAMAVSQS